MIYRGREVRKSIETYAKLRFLYFRYNELVLYDNLSEIDKIRFINQILISRREFSTAIKNKYDLEVMQYCFSYFMISDMWISDFIKNDIMGKVVTRQDVFRTLSQHKCASYKYYEINTVLQTMKEFSYLFRLHGDDKVSCTVYEYDENTKDFNYKEKLFWNNLRELKHDNSFRIKYRNMRFIRIPRPEYMPKDNTVTNRNLLAANA